MKPFSVGRRYEFRGMAADLPRAGQGRSRAKSGPVAEPKSAEAKGTPVITEGDIDDHFLRYSPLFLFLEHIDHEGIWGRRCHAMTVQLYRRRPRMRSVIVPLMRRPGAKLLRWEDVTALFGRSVRYTLS